MKQNQEQKNIINHDCDEITRTRGGPDKGKKKFKLTTPLLGKLQVPKFSDDFWGDFQLVFVIIFGTIF